MSNRVTYIGSNGICTDNEVLLLQTIIEIICYSDPGFNITISKRPTDIMCHITPSSSNFKQDLVNNLMWINKNLGIKIHFSSSLGISSKISFTIDLKLPQEVVPLGPKQLHNGQ